MLHEAQPSSKKPTISDRDILLYFASYLRGVRCMPRQRMRFVTHGLLASMNKPTDNDSHEQLKETLNRLTSNTDRNKVFGLIEYWKIIKKDDNRMIAIEVKLSDWFYRSILTKDPLSINRTIFFHTSP